MILKRNTTQCQRQTNRLAATTVHIKISQLQLRHHSILQKACNNETPAARAARPARSLA
jgi:hypothetical protein